MLYKKVQIPNMIRKTTLLLLFFLTSTQLSFAQQDKHQKLVDSYNEYAKLSRETAYCHLNKSTFILGETLAFSGYLFYKDSKLPSKITKNLYCVITDKDNKVIKSKMLLVEDGYTNNSFQIDSLFTAGHYTFKAYTNWMKNFDEHNAFVETFKVLAPNEKFASNKKNQKKLDVQFLPEGGHLVTGVKSNVGVIVKDGSGFGVSDIKGDVYDSKNNLITSFETNKVGISRFPLLPNLNDSYKVKFNHSETPYEFDIQDIKAKGIGLRVNNLKNSITLEIGTNDETFKELKGQQFKMTIHNGKQLRSLDVTFESKNVALVVNRSKLFTGINILTLFNKDNKPLLERLVFNHEGLKIEKSSAVNHTNVQDSLKITLSYKGMNTDKLNSNLSISVLPRNTKSYERHHNIISHTYIQPYVKGYVENANYYFTDINAKKKFELDNLLITQGWSSYDWKNIFEGTIEESFVFEDGIVLKASQKKRKSKRFLIYPLELSQAMNINLKKDEKDFVVSKLYPVEEEKLGLAAMTKKGKLYFPNMKVEFTPSRIVTYNSTLSALNTKTRYTKEFEVMPFDKLNLKGVEVLDEIVVEVDERQEKLQKLQGNQFNKVDVLDDKKRRLNLTFAGYINYYVPEYFAYESFGSLHVERRVSTTWSNQSQTPLIYLDDLLLSNLQPLYGFNMNIVDYVTVNENGVGEGLAGVNGVIKIYTLSDFAKAGRNRFRNTSFPLSYSRAKKFYTPLYENYNDSFYQNYGVIDWVPNAKIGKDGNISFKVSNPSNGDIKLFIEGVTSDGTFFSEIKTVEVNSGD